MRQTAQRFRLKSSTVASTLDNGKSVVLLLPTGAEVIPLDTLPDRVSEDDGREICVEWQGKTLSMFLIDILERGEHI